MFKNKIFFERSGADPNNYKMSYIIKSLEQLNSIHYDSFSRLEKISFELDQGEFVNDKASKEYESILDKINKELDGSNDLWKDSYFWGIAASGTVIGTITNHLLSVSLLYLSIVGTISIISGVYVTEISRQRAKKAGYNLFSELRNRINLAYEQSHKEYAYRTNPPTLETIE